jgi:hypothetical protein
VDVFLTASIPEYEPDSGVRALALLLLSDAYKCGGSMAIRFTKDVEGDNVPRDLVSLASGEGIQLQYIEDGLVTPEEAVQLYAALTGFSSEIQSELNTLERSGRLSTAMVCYAIQNGKWDRSEVEAILRTAPDPGGLLSGGYRPELRQLYLQGLYYGRAAALFGSLDRHLRYRAHSQSEGVVHLEDDERALELHLDGETFLATYTSLSEPLPLPWVAAPPGDVVIPKNEPFSVLVRARDSADLKDNLAQDIALAGQLANAAQIGKPIFLLVPRDFEKLDEALRQRLLSGLPSQVGIMVYPEFCSSLDEEITRRISGSGAMRQ